MLSTLIKLGEQLSNGRGEWDDIIDFPNIAKEREKNIKCFVAELLFDLGLDKSVAGITKFCVHPAEWRKAKTIIGGTKNIHPERIQALQPDLIISCGLSLISKSLKQFLRAYPAKQHWHLGCSQPGYLRAGRRPVDHSGHYRVLRSGLAV